MVHDSGAYLYITLQLIICNVIISMLHHHVSYMKDLPNTREAKPQTIRFYKISVTSYVTSCPIYRISIGLVLYDEDSFTKHFQFSKDLSFSMRKSHQTMFLFHSVLFLPGFWGMFQVWLNLFISLLIIMLQNTRNFYPPFLLVQNKTVMLLQACAKLLTHHSQATV